MSGSRRVRYCGSVTDSGVVLNERVRPPTFGGGEVAG
jgi:hypothetical protein